jgi:protein-L-isoaspartate(D-aspartate) O-methyltransferase
MKVLLAILAICCAVVFWLMTRPADPDDASRREAMVRDQIAARGLANPKVLAAMRKIPRRLFVPFAARLMAYGDHPLPIGSGQTISQPYIVALMTERLEPKPTDRVLEIGTGSGYQAAILAELVQTVYTIEIVPELASRAKEILTQVGCANVLVRQGDGYKGWPEAAPFDGIIVTCAPDAVPEALVVQLKEGGRMIIPVGPQGGVQRLILLTKRGGRVVEEHVEDVVFVPMVRSSPAP